MKQRFIVVGLGFGDEGKGTIVDYLVREHGASAVVRFNGGAQAAHRVVNPDGSEHVFAQFGSGTFHPGCETYLSKHTIVNPLNLFNENDHLIQLGIDDALDRLSIDVEALIVTPFHVAANRLRELARGPIRHGSCGQGIGEAVSDSLRAWLPSIKAGDLFFESDLVQKLQAVQRAKRNVYDFLLADPDLEKAGWFDHRFVEESQALLDPDLPEMLAESYLQLAPNLVSDWKHRLRNDETIVFEGAQGILLDENCGFHPHTTWSTATSENAHRLLSVAGYDGERRTIGVTRCYLTRHGDGPLPTWDPVLSELLTDPVNMADPWQGDFRVGNLDLGLLNYAIDADGRIGEIAVTCLDRALPNVPAFWWVAESRDVTPSDPGDGADGELRGTQLTTRDPDELCNIIAMRADRPVTIRSWGPSANYKLTWTSSSP